MVSALEAKHDEPPSNFAFYFNMRHYRAAFFVGHPKNLVRRCTLTLSSPR